MDSKDETRRGLFSTLMLESLSERIKLCKVFNFLSASLFVCLLFVFEELGLVLFRTTVAKERLLHLFVFWFLFPESGFYYDLLLLVSFRNCVGGQ